VQTARAVSQRPMVFWRARVSLGCGGEAGVANRVYAAESMAGAEGEVQRSYVFFPLIHMVAVAACSGDSATPGNAPAGCSPVSTGTSNVFVDSIPSDSACVVRSLSVDQGRVPCRMVEATVGSCDCSAALGRVPTDAGFADAVQRRLRADATCDSAGGPPCAQLCIREIVQLKGEQLTACQNDAGAGAPPGFCYVDPAAGLGDPSVVADCPATSRRKIRILGDSGSRQSWRFIACSPVSIVDGAPP
jgi:hypothetical protein